MPKPILIMKMPRHVSLVELARAGDVLERKGIDKDYHYLIVQTGVEDITFELISVIDLDPVEFETFKQSIKDELENCKQ